MVCPSFLVGTQVTSLALVLSSIHAVCLYRERCHIVKVKGSLISYLLHLNIGVGQSSFTIYSYISHLLTIFCLLYTKVSHLMLFLLCLCISAGRS